MSSIRILVIEDNAADIELLRFSLDRQGKEYDLEVLQDGEAALQFVEERRKGIRTEDPCVILLDFYLPKFDGLQILTALKLEPAITQVHVIVLSSMTDQLAEEEIRRLGANFRLKPVSLGQYIEFGAEIFALCDQGVLA
ncbi:MAG TPA: response regulator [Bryobacteraceae bacterium]|jgi:CheY-like chemotaxis protein